MEFSISQNSKTGHLKLYHVTIHIILYVYKNKCNTFIINGHLSSFYFSVMTMYESVCNNILLSVSILCSACNSLLCIYESLRNSSPTD